MIRKLQDSVLEFRKLIAIRSVVVPILSAITVICITVSVSSLNTYIVYDGDRISVLNSHSDNCAAALNEMGIMLEKKDLVSMPEQPENGIAKIHILRSNEVTVLVDGRSITVPAYRENVLSALKRADISVSPNDIVSPALTVPVKDGMEITVTRVGFERVEEHSDIPFTTEKRASKNLEAGKQRVIQKGVPGQKLRVHEIEMKNGAEVGRLLLSESVIKEPVKKIIEYGTKPKDTSGSLSIAGGKAPVSYKKLIEVTATAYTTERWKRKTTATGAVARYGMVAVDPKVIPLGTKLYITSLDGKSWIYGTAVAADTGGSIKGNKIDLFFNTHNECISFGRRKAKVYILE